MLEKSLWWRALLLSKKIYLLRYTCILPVGKNSIGEKSKNAIDCLNRLFGIFLPTKSQS